MKTKLYIISAFCALTVLPVKAQNCIEPDSTNASTTSNTTVERPTTARQWLWGIGGANVLDTYLSPLEYTGPNASFLHRTERQARWGKGKVTTHSLYTAHLAYLHSPTDDGKEFDGEFSAAGGWMYNFIRTANWRLAAGATIEASGGFTYNTRGTNNPAQGRFGTALCASGLAEYHFPLFRKRAVARLLLDAQALGVQFAPEYGQSYYEIFSLGHTDGIIHFTHPGNCPTTRLQVQVELPVAKARLTLGYLADVRQSKLGGLKRHAWRNSFVIGYTRNLQIIR